MQSNLLSHNTQTYLHCFDDILHQMIHRMEQTELSCDLSLFFIHQMIPHHQAAIQMSKNLLKYTTFIPLQDIACHIIQEQTQSIQDMLDIQNQCHYYLNSDLEVHHYFQKNTIILQTMFDDMQKAKISNDININFIHEMIPHHEGAIQMSKNLLKYPICPQLVPILEAIISSQEQGVKEMRMLLKTITTQ